jgi:hypothetical protein
MLENRFSAPPRLGDDLTMRLVDQSQLGQRNFIRAAGTRLSKRYPIPFAFH